MRFPRVHTARTARRARGSSLTEMAIASACTIVAVGLAIPAFKSVGDAGDEGASRLTAQAENHRALLLLAGELQNASTTATDEAGAARFEVLDDTAAPEPLEGAGGEIGFEGRLGDREGHGAGKGRSTPTGVPIGGGGGGSGRDEADKLAKAQEDLNEKLAEAEAKRDEEIAEAEGRPDEDKKVEKAEEHYARDVADARAEYEKKTRKIQNAKSADPTGSAVVSEPSLRPRQAVIPVNSVLRFQKVVGFDVDADGVPVVNWGPWIEYRIADHHLVRTENGETRPVAPFCAGFRCEVSDSGTVLVTLVSQKRANSTGEVVYQANQLEVSPKN